MEENDILRTYSPLRVVLYMSTGPLLDNICSNLNPTIEMALVSNSIGGDSVRVLGFASLIRFIGITFCNYLHLALVEKVTRLNGEGNQEASQQVVTDLYRVGFLMMIVVAIALYFASKPLLLFMGSTEEAAEQSVRYLMPIIFCLPVTLTFQLATATVQSQGKSLKAGLLQLAAFVLNCGVFLPIGLFGLHIPLSMTGVPFVLALLIPGVSCMIYTYHKSKSWRTFIQKFSKETWHSLRLSLPYLFLVLVSCLGPTVQLSYLMKAAGYDPAYAQVFSVFQRVQNLFNSLNHGFGQGFVAAGSFASGAKLYSRLLKLLGWAILLTFIPHLIWTPLMLTSSPKVTSLWLTSEEEQALTSVLLLIPFYSNFLSSFSTVLSNFLSAINKPIPGIVPPIVGVVTCLAMTFILYYTQPHNPIRMMWALFATDVLTFASSLVISVPSLWKLWKERTEAPDAQLTTLIQSQAGYQ